MNREENISRYPHLWAISKRQRNEAVDLVAEAATLDCARRMGWRVGRMLLLDNADGITLVFDLLVHAS